MGCLMLVIFILGFVLEYMFVRSGNLVIGLVGIGAMLLGIALGRKLYGPVKWPK